MPRMPEPISPSPCLECEGCDPGEEVALHLIPELRHAQWQPSFSLLCKVLMPLQRLGPDTCLARGTER